MFNYVQVWEKAAEALRELAKVGNLVFPGLEQTRASGGHGSDTAAAATGSETEEEEEDLVNGLMAAASGVLPFRWPGPQDFREADEIEVQGNNNNTVDIKMESEATSADM